jgi:acyl transferase domain-containing protein
LEEPPELPESSAATKPWQLLTLSARNKKSLDAACERLAEHLVAHPEEKLADVAYTLKEGRRAFDQRRVLACRDHAEAVELLRTKEQRRVFTHSSLGSTPDVVFMFPGGGAQYVGMARGLYETEPAF